MQGYCSFAIAALGRGIPLVKNFSRLGLKRMSSADFALFINKVEWAAFDDPQIILSIILLMEG